MPDDIEMINRLFMIRDAGGCRDYAGDVDGYM